MYILASSSTSLNAGSCPAVGGPTQHLNGMPIAIGPTPPSEIALLDSSGSLECADGVPSSHSISALSVAPVDFHAQHFAKPSGQSDGCSKDTWIWFYPIESQEIRTPPKENEPSLSQCPKSLAIACRLCWASNTWMAYKNCDGVVTMLRKHMMKKHAPMYEGYLRTGAWETELRKQKGGRTDKPFHLAGLLDCMIRWMVVNDQVSRVFVLFLYPLSDDPKVY